MGKFDVTLKKAQGAMTDQTRKVVEQLSGDDPWAYKVMGCNKSAFDNGMAMSLKEFKKLNVNDRNAHLEAVLAAFPECIKELTSKGKGAIVRARNFIDAIGKKCVDGELTDDHRFDVICAIRVMSKDLLAEQDTPEGTPKKTETKKGFSVKGTHKQADGTRKNFTSKVSKAEKPSKSKVEVKRPKQKTLLDSLVETSTKVVDERGNKSPDDTERGEYRAEVYKYVIDHVDDKGFEKFKEMPLKQIGKFADSVIDGIFKSRDEVLVAISDGDSIEDQFANLYNGWRNGWRRNKSHDKVVDDIIADMKRIDPEVQKTAKLIADGFSTVLGGMISDRALEWEKLMGRA